MERFSEIVIRYNKIVIIITVLLTLFFGFFLKDLKVNADAISYFPKSDPIVRLFNHIGDEYGGNSLAIVALETDDVFNRETIENIQYFTIQFQSLEGVSYVTSLTNVLDIREGEEDSVEIARLVDEYDLPENKEELHKLKEYTLSKDMYRGRLVSNDSKATLIICRLMGDVNKTEVASQIREIVKKRQIKEKAYFAGIPYQTLDFTDIIINDLKTLIPFVIIVISVSLLISFRSWLGVLLPLLSVCASTIWTLGLMSILGVPITAISNGVPIILLAVGTAYSIHVINRFQEYDVTDENRTLISKKALAGIGITVILSGLTTMIGFISFIFGSYLTIIRSFGIFAGIGVMLSVFTAITFVPSVLSLLHTKRNKSNVAGDISEGNGTSSFMNRVGEWMLKNEKLIVGVGFAVVIISVVGLPFLSREVDMMDYFKPETNIRITENMITERFGGSTPLQILVNGDIQDPDVLEEMAKMEDYLESLYKVYNAQSVAELIEEMNDVLGDGKAIPDSRSKVINLWFLVEGEEIMEQLVNSDKTEAVIQANISDMDTQRLNVLIEDIENYISKINNPKVTFSQTGFPYIYHNMSESILKSLILSLSIAIILVFFCLVILLRSFVGGLTGLVPIVFTLLVIFGFMGYTGIPLDIFTVLIGSITIGIGIDYSIHFINRFRVEFNISSSEHDALNITLRTAGKAIIINVVTVAAGFLVFALANMVPAQRFGVLSALTMISAGAASITLLPSVILLSKAAFIGDWSEFAGKLAENLRGRIVENGKRVSKQVDQISQTAAKVVKNVIKK